MSAQKAFEKWFSSMIKRQAFHADGVFEADFRQAFDAGRASLLEEIRKGGPVAYQRVAVPHLFIPAEDMLNYPESVCNFNPLYTLPKE